MTLIFASNLTEVIKHIIARDTSSSIGVGKTGLVFSDITAYYVRAGGVLTQLTMVDITTLGTWDTDVTSDKLGFKLLHNTNAPGGIELHLPDNIVVSGARQVSIFLQADGTFIAPLEIQLDIDALSQNISIKQSTIRSTS